MRKPIMMLVSRLGVALWAALLVTRETRDRARLYSLSLAQLPAPPLDERQGADVVTIIGIITWQRTPLKSVRTLSIRPSRKDQTSTLAFGYRRRP